jgi:hypothetical protein
MLATCTRVDTSMIGSAYRGQELMSELELRYRIRCWMLFDRELELAAGNARTYTCTRARAS